jgi:hypothetical protein
MAGELKNFSVSDPDIILAFQKAVDAVQQHKEFITLHNYQVFWLDGQWNVTIFYYDKLSENEKPYKHDEGNYL